MGESEIFSLMMPTLLPIAVGWAIVRMHLLTVAATDVLSTLFLHVCAPALMIVTLAREDLASLIAPRYILATLFLMLGLYAALLTAHLVFLKRELDVSAFAAFTGTKFNAVVMGFPVLFATIGRHAMVAVTINVVIGYFTILPFTLLLCDVCRSAHTGQTGACKLFLNSLRKAVTNPLVVATIIGLFLAGVRLHLPDWLDNTLLTLGNGALAMALLAVGMSLNTLSFKKSGADIIWMSGVRVILSPALAIVAAKLFGLSPIFAVALVVSFSLPTAKMVLPLAEEGGIYVEETAGIIAVTTASLLFVWPVAIWICEKLWPGAIMTVG